MSIGQNIKRRRQQLDMTLEDVAKLVGVSRQTMSRYETGAIGNIPSDKIEALAKALITTPGYLMGWSDDSPTTSPAAPAPDDDGISGKYYRLNDHGQLVLMEMADFLLSKYPAFPELEERAAPNGGNVISLEEERKRRMAPWFLHPSAAGYSAPVLTEDYIEVELPDDAPEGTDYCVTVAGDSMEPYLHDRQRVYVKRVESLEEGEVGVWFWQGETFIKQAVEGPFGEIYLLSANPAREDANKTIPADQADDLKLLGKVLLAKRLPMPHYH